MKRFAFVMLALAVSAASAHAGDKLKALIIDGQNNHNWVATTPVLQRILENSGRFAVTVSTAPDKKKGTAEQWDAWRPKFADYDVVVSNYSGKDWPQPVRDAFIAYVKDGGGFVPVHAANNSFGNWKEYNQIIGVGGWGGRNEKSGPYLRLRDGKWTHDTTKGRGGSHGAQHPFLMTTRAADHPIMKGLPKEWRHSKDELYDRLRGPAENVTVLASAFADPKTRGSGEHEPLLMTISYGKGRCFHTALGHAPYSMYGVGFQVTLARGCEWAATGKVTIPAPASGALPADKPAEQDPFKVEAPKAPAPK